MRKIPTVIVASIVSLLLMWISYSWGYRDGVVAGLDREHSSVYSRASLELKVLELLRAGHYERASESLSVFVASDIDWLRQIQGVKEEVSIINISREAIRSGLHQPTWNDPDEDQTASLQSRYDELVRSGEFK